jgi:hypothetical protein
MSSGEDRASRPLLKSVLSTLGDIVAVSSLVVKWTLIGVFLFFLFVMLLIVICEDPYYKELMVDVQGRDGRDGGVLADCTVAPVHPGEPTRPASGTLPGHFKVVFRR